MKQRITPNFCIALFQKAEQGQTIEQLEKETQHKKTALKKAIEKGKLLSAEIGFRKDDPRNDLHEKTKRILEAEGLFTIKQIAEELERSGFKRTPDFGKLCIQEVKEWLSKRTNKNIEFEVGEFANRGSKRAVVQNFACEKGEK